MNTPSTYDISKLVREHGPFMERLARGLTGSSAEAEDLLHDTWIEALRHGAEAMRSERGWLITAMRRRAGAIRRRFQPATGALDGMEESLAGPAGFLPDAAIERMEAERLLGAALGSMREPYRTAIYLRYREDWTPTRIAAETDTPVATVKTRLRRGLEYLRVELDGLIDPSAKESPRERWMSLLLPVAIRGGPLPDAVAPAVPASGLWAALIMKKYLLALLLLVFSAAALWKIQRPGQTALTPVEPALAALPEGDAEGDAGDTQPEPQMARVAPRDQVERVPPKERAQAATSLAVIVLGPDAEPVSGGSVVAFRAASAGAPSLHWVESLSASGVAVFENVPPGRYHVQESTGMARESVDLGAGKENTVTLRQVSDPLFRVHGKVVDPDGHAVPGATIWGQDRGPFLPITRTGADGGYEARVGSGVTLQAGLPGRLPSGSVYVRSLDGDSLTGRPCTFTLGDTGARLTGRVVDDQGAPVEGALVFAGSLERFGSTGEMFTSPAPVATRTGEGGHFEYGHSLPNGTWRLGALAPGGQGVVRWLEVAGADIDVLLTVQPGATIEGTVLGVDGSPAEGGVVSVRPIRSGDFADDLEGILGIEHYAPIEASGAYRLTGVLGLDFDLSARTPDGQPLAQARVQVAPLAPGETRRIDLQLNHGAVLAGIVVDRDGAPMPGIAIYASQQQGLSYREFVQTDAAGRFRLTSVPVRSEATDLWRIRAVALSKGRQEEIGFVRDVAIDTEDITIVATRPVLADAFLSGRVVFPGEELPGNVEVLLSRVHVPARKRYSSVLVDVDPKTGVFHHGPLVAGSYRITAIRVDESVGAVEGIVVGAGETVLVPDLTVRFGE